MPRLVSMQTLWWGLLPAAPIPLAHDRVNAFIGANGSGKSTLLDAIKLLLGQTTFDSGDGEASRTAGSYILGETVGSGDEETTRVADFALVQGTFLNPPDARGQRPFAEAGRGLHTPMRSP
jgi:uncharacterized protein YPO0396